MSLSRARRPTPGAKAPRDAKRATPAKPLLVLCISGPNLQLLGTREPEVYGRETLADIHARLAQRAATLGLALDARQTNHEGTIVDWIGESPARGVSGLILNPGAYTHTSIAIYDALGAVSLPCVEVHLSNPDAREAFRRHSWIAPACVGRIAGFGGDSYELALDGLARVLARKRAGT
jgi:3-dehydroquinate dehydratase-2